MRVLLIDHLTYSTVFSLVNCRTVSVREIK